MIVNAIKRPDKHYMCETHIRIFWIGFVVASVVFKFLCIIGQNGGKEEQCVECQGLLPTNSSVSFTDMEDLKKLQECLLSSNNRIAIPMKVESLLIMTF